MKFKKKAAIIEAVQFTNGNHKECENFIGLDNIDKTLNYPNIVTLEGTLRVSEGDWIVRGYSDELGYHFWPVKPDYFRSAYESVSGKKDVEKSAGLYEKFNVSRTDGKSAPGEKHEDCRYFVIDLDHDEFAFYALRQYALSCKGEYPELAKDLDSVCKELLSKK